jgi:YHS domain-containing protein
MLITRHTRAAAFIGMASLLPFHGARMAAAAAPEDTPVFCVVEDHDFTLRDVRGRYVILHFLPETAVEEQERLVREHIAHERALAGVFTMFVRPDEAGARALSARLGKQPAEFAVDKGGRLASEFKIKELTGPVVVALNETGMEMFRLSAPPEDASVAALSQRFAAAWKSPATAHYNLPKGSNLAVQGYDVVSYFKDNRAVKGEEKIKADYRGVTYRFSSEAHRDAFIAGPTKYLPTYGGWCASAIGAKAEKVSIDPTNFKVKDGRLFLFYKGLFADALKDWNKNEKAWEPAADTNWERIAGEDPVVSK